MESTFNGGNMDRPAGHLGTVHTNTHTYTHIFCAVKFDRNNNNVIKGKK